jgi:hypothetical protein
VAAPRPAPPVEPPAAEAVVTTPPAAPVVAPSEAPKAPEPAGKGTSTAAPPSTPRALAKATIRTPDAPIAVPVVPAGPSPWDAPAVASEGVVSVTSDPPGAVVRVDGKLRGKTPLDTRLPFGRHDVELSLDGYALVQRSIDVRSATLKLPNQLEVVSREGTVQVVVPEDWVGALLVVDGRPRGKVPASIRLPEGAHRFEVRRGDFSAIDERIVRFEASGTTKLVLDPR